jgi:uncharacterized phage-like protein YoqJ
MFEKAITPETKKSLAILGKSGILKECYLAGGTALCLQFGHRISFDLDFFTKKEFKPKILAQRIKKIFPEFKVDKLEWGTILGYLGKTRFSLFFYDYPLLFKPLNFLGIRIARAKDIAPMKIAAICERGTKRDFIDLFFILKVKKVLTLDEALTLYDRKFKLLKENKFHILKSLCYFEDAEKEPMPKMIEKVKWSEIKEFFKKEVLKVSKSLLK